jgi:hypothetical protein
MKTLPKGTAIRYGTGRPWRICGADATYYFLTRCCGTENAMLPRELVERLIA